ncbi:K/Mg/Cd/Cu/Zn/Na/Ca/Na/H-transporter ATPase, P-type ATPase [Alteracholeplasma palmae J233]|uniref:K/Mg/Cd/Cu/Zn/Na/Ca/Na/H-transporter ATPase, P-type ATPase n=1 Tax=Alteracholeplasma palmae (strain ATCC 49389 / J233) TaxID=1318466 RepID=U4KL41_ALTPJ|nr:heavy metal translocating P-type ATPase [Alteracholeplasma palmae]CCV64594.1 K/Mg/Cd/Cu/Zn/Na/Ca/Na/H-transporter ATPase, P-type ATPase [Alteracholeplasma palmae J233]
MSHKEKHLHHKHHHKEHDHEEHDHHHGGKLNIILYFIGLLTFVIALFINHSTIQMVLYLVTFVLSGYHVMSEGIIDTFKDTFKKRRLHPNVHLLMTLAAIGAIIIKEYREAALLILIFAGAHMLEDYAEGRSKKEITNLLKLNPTTARLIEKDDSIKIVDVSELKIGDRLQVLNGDQIPTDGLIIKGEAFIDEASITGESIPVLKTKDDFVFGSTINGDKTFEMEVTKDSSETVFAKIVALVSQTQTNVSKTAAFIKRLEPIYVTIILILTPLFYLMGYYLLNWQNDAFYRTMVFLIGASPCALAATDIPATLSAISNLAKRGVLFKGGSYLSNLSEVKAVAFDKTGTLTEGKPVVTNFYFKDDALDQNKLISILVAMEKKSNHPLAQAIIKYFNSEDKLNIEVENIIGVGIETTYLNKKYKIGKPSSYDNISENLKRETEKYEYEGKTVVYLGENNEVVMLIAIQDIPKESSIKAIQYFNQENIHTVMLTGDAIKTGEAIGRKLAISEVKGNILPEDKANVINELKKNYHMVAMLGDGVNDAPALVSADIGIAMGSGTDIAIDVADAVLMQNDLEKFVYTHQVAKKLRRVVWQNIIFAMFVVVFLIVMNIVGLMELPIAVLIHEGSTLVVILSGLRMLLPLRSRK